MGWRELRRWLEVLDELRRRDARSRTTDPDSWDGEGQDDWWEKGKTANQRARGR